MIHFFLSRSHKSAMSGPGIVSLKEERVPY